VSAGDSIILGDARELVYVRMNGYDWSGAGVTDLKWDGEHAKNPVAPWMRAAVKHTSSRQLTMGPVGGRRFLRNGNFIVLIFGQAGNRTGIKLVDTLANLVRKLFEGIPDLSGMVFGASNVQEIGFDGRAFFQVNVVTPFWYCEIA
jgi:hypothetical protein